MVAGGCWDLPPHPDTLLPFPIRQLEQAQAEKLSLQVHVDYDWEPAQEFPYDSEDELEEKVPMWGYGGDGDTPHPQRGCGGADPGVGQP